MEHAHPVDTEVVGMTEIAQAFRQTIADFLQSKDDQSIHAAIDAASRGGWGFIPATGYEWPFSEPDGVTVCLGPQRVTIETGRPFEGSIITETTFNEDVDIRDGLLKSRAPFGVTGRDGQTTVWHGVEGDTGPWPLFRRFILPAEPTREAGEIGPSDYAVVPYLRLPEGS